MKRLAILILLAAPLHAQEVATPRVRHHSEWNYAELSGAHSPKAILVRLPEGTNPRAHLKILCKDIPGVGARRRIFLHASTGDSGYDPEQEQTHATHATARFHVHPNPLQSVSANTLYQGSRFGYPRRPGGHGYGTSISIDYGAMGNLFKLMKKGEDTGNLLRLQIHFNRVGSAATTCTDADGVNDYHTRVNGCSQEVFSLKGFTDAYAKLKHECPDLPAIPEDP